MRSRSNPEFTWYHSLSATASAGPRQGRLVTRDGHDGSAFAGSCCTMKRGLAAKPLRQHWSRRRRTATVGATAEEELDVCSTEEVNAASSCFTSEVLVVPELLEALPDDWKVIFALCFTMNLKCLCGAGRLQMNWKCSLYCV